MTAQIIDGKAIAKQIRDEIGREAAQLTQHTGTAPGLATVLVGDDPASHVYVRNKRCACEQAGIISHHHELPTSTKQSELLELVRALNGDAQINGILVQAPLPDHIDATSVVDAILPIKDVDAFHAENVGRMLQGRPRFLPCTPFGIQQLLHRTSLSVNGAHVVIIGRSDIVGKPLAMMLAQRHSLLGPAVCNATVTICHSRTVELPRITRQADVLIAAIGQPRLVTAQMIKPGAVVIDVGINRTEDGLLVGDVDFAAARDVAAYITPVPGGVGPLTIAILLQNTIRAARLQAER